jgi:hypothetical protein
MLIEAIRGLATGVLIAFVVLYSLQPKTPYPKWIVATFEHPWVFVLAFIVACWLLSVDKVIGILAFIAVATVTIDYYVLGKRRMNVPQQRGESVIASGYSDTGYDDYDVATFDTEGPALQQVDLDMPTYPMFNSGMDFQPGGPSPF